MTISVWRYSHLALAVSSCLFMALAALSGIILAFEPISQKSSGYSTSNFERITLAQAVTTLKATYPGVSDVTVDINGFVTVKGTDATGKNILAYVDARTGKVLGKPQKQSEFFQWVTAFHRSLFLHKLGRLFVGVTAFLLFLIAISGAVLILKRQSSLKRFFGAIAKDGFAQYWHVVLGRLSLIPIVLIAITGSYLSMARFGFFPEKKIVHNIDTDNVKSDPQRRPANFKGFKNIMLADVQSIQYPFSEFPEDYYTLKLRDREVVVNQFTGEVLSEVRYPYTAILTTLSLNLHTGRGSLLLAAVLAVAAANILFFIYSGFAITLKRRSGRIRNRYKAEESTIIILAGSENGSTLRYAVAVQQQLTKQGEKVYLGDLNQYRAFPVAQHLIVMTATYGLGEAPSNAKKFISLLGSYSQQQQLSYSILGFGSHAYPDFCRYAFEINHQLAQQPWAKALTEIYTVNDHSPDDILRWAEAWSQQSGVLLNELGQLPVTSAKDLRKFTVTSKVSSAESTRTFQLRLKPNRKIKLSSGDLLAIYPANDYRERLYSIGVVNNEIQLSVRLHEGGLGSGFLNNLKVGDTLRARVSVNSQFHFPKQAKQVIMIANGTGIAPFLGMICQNKQHTSCQLYCGFRDHLSFDLYNQFLKNQQAAGRLMKLHLALSREGSKQYVSELVERDADVFATALKNNGVLMLCGSLAMQKDVLEVLDNICRKMLGEGISFYQSHGQVLMDCY